MWHFSGSKLLLIHKSKKEPCYTMRNPFFLSKWPYMGVLLYSNKKQLALRVVTVQVCCYLFFIYKKEKHVLRFVSVFRPRNLLA